MSPVLAAASDPATLLPSSGGFVLIGAGAFLLPIVARRLRLPAVVLEILYGLVLGPELLDLIEHASADARFIELLAELGLLLLMFLAGFEVDFSRLERRGSAPVLTGLAIYGLIVAAAWLGFGLLETTSTEQRFFLTLLTSAASLGIVIPALRATGRTGTSLGQLTIVTAVIAEFLSAVAIVVFGVFVVSGFGPKLLEVPALFLVMGASLLLLRRAAWWFPERFERLFASHDPDEMGIRASLALLFVFVGVSLALDVEGILGAFLAGAMFSFVFRDSGDLEARLNAFSYGFFIPVFFINVGIEFPLGELSDPSVLGRAAALIGVAIAVKLLPALLMTTRGHSLRASLAAEVLLAGQLSVIIALVYLGLELGLLDEGFVAGAILLVGVTAIFSPIVFRLLAPPLDEPETAVTDDL
ncbi:MAG: cation:proton antiporter [Acidimicrobiia bacterium]